MGKYIISKRLFFFSFLFFVSSLAVSVLLTLMVKPGNLLADKKNLDIFHRMLMEIVFKTLSIYSSANIHLFGMRLVKILIRHSI